jgi:RHS repeat-associated protein
VFDANRGFLKNLRTYAATSPAGPGDTDTIVTTARMNISEGPVPTVLVRTSSFGGDEGSLAIPTYVKESKLRYGGSVRDAWRSCDDSDAQPFHVIETTGRDPATGLPLTIADSSGAAATYTYDALGRVTSVLPPSGVTPQTYTYACATQGRSGTETPQALGESSLNISRGPLPTGSRAEGPDLTWGFDFLGRATHEDEKLPGANAINTTRWFYSVKGLLTDEIINRPNGSIPNGDTHHTYDQLDREVEVKAPDGNIRTLIYNGTRTRDVRNHNVALDTGNGDSTLSEIRDGFGRLVRVNDNVVRADYGYDPSNHLSGVTLTDVNHSSVHQSRSFVYDGRGFLINETHPELGPGTMHYTRIDALGHAQQVQYGSHTANTLTFIYDRAERLIEVDALHPPLGQSDPSSSMLEQTYFYPEGGNTTGTAGKLWKTLRRNYVPTPYVSGMGMLVDVQKELTYDSAGRLSTLKLSSSYNGGLAATTTYHYDDLDQVTKIDYPSLVRGDGAVPAQPDRHVSNDYKRGRLVFVGVPGDTPRFAALTYWDNGMVATVTRPRGAGLVDTVNPDGSGMARPSEFVWQYAGSSSTASTSSGVYAYDGAGNIRQIGTDTYLYDKAYRLTQARIDSRTRSYNYDPFGNLTAWCDATACNANNSHGAPATVASNRMTPAMYDDLGNVIQMPDGRPASISGGQPLTFKFDLLSAMTNFDAAQIGRTFLYDADGERVATLDYKSGSALKEHWYLRGSGNMVLRDFDRSGGNWTWQEDYVYRGSTLSATILAGEKIHDVHVDHLGSTRFVTDETGHQVVIGSTVDTPRKYWPFGDLTVTRPLAERMAFTGQERDSDGSSTGAATLDYMHAREYSAAVSRFLSVDPVLDRERALHHPQEWNRYTYVANNPMNETDPTGKCGETGSSAICPVPTQPDLDIFFFGSFTGTTDTPFVSGAVEALPLVGYNSNKGFYGGGIVLTGVEFGFQENKAAFFTGEEKTTGSPATGINIQELSGGVEIPSVAGAGVGAGRYSTDAQKGGFAFFSFELAGQELSVGAGASKDLLIQLTRPAYEKVMSFTRKWLAPPIVPEE